MKSSDTGIKRILKAFVYSYQGFCATFKSEAAFRQDLVCCLFFGGLAIWFNIPILHRCLLFASLILILLAELINTAIETVIDRISEEYHELSKKAKDIGSLLVLLSFICAGILWLGVIFADYEILQQQINGLL
jgi:diacylglycerol kinase (ATP)